MCRSTPISLCKVFLAKLTLIAYFTLPNTDSDPDPGTDIRPENINSNKYALQ